MDELKGMLNAPVLPTMKKKRPSQARFRANQLSHKEGDHLNIEVEPSNEYSNDHYREDTAEGTTISTTKSQKNLINANPLPRVGSTGLGSACPSNMGILKASRLNIQTPQVDNSKLLFNKDQRKPEVSFAAHPGPTSSND